MLAIVLLVLWVQPHGCKEGSLFEDCEEYKKCLADPPSCASLIISDAGVAPGSSASISGTIPTEIGSLTALTKLVVGENKMSGTIPETIGLLTMLVSLFLGSASGFPQVDASLLSGTLPSSLGNLALLEKLWVYQTQVSGTLPPSLTEMVSLQWINLDSSKFVGTIPESIGALTGLTWL